jgi:hypothetical protein
MQAVDARCPPTIAAVSSLTFPARRTTRRAAWHVPTVGPMHSAPLSRSQEVTMLTRRIAVPACALCLAVPGVAGAQPIHDPPPVTPTTSSAGFRSTSRLRPTPIRSSVAPRRSTPRAASRAPARTPATTGNSTGSGLSRPSSSPPPTAPQACRRHARVERLGRRRHQRLAHRCCHRGGSARCPRAGLGADRERTTSRPAHGHVGRALRGGVGVASPLQPCAHNRTSAKAGQSSHDP